MNQPGLAGGPARGFSGSKIRIRCIPGIRAGRNLGVIGSVHQPVWYDRLLEFRWIARVATERGLPT
jgi:hypothetical protein